MRDNTKRFRFTWKWVRKNIRTDNNKSNGRWCAEKSKNETIEESLFRWECASISENTRTHTHTREQEQTVCNGVGQCVRLARTTYASIQSHQGLNCFAFVERKAFTLCAVLVVVVRHSSNEVSFWQMLSHSVEAQIIRMIKKPNQNTLLSCPAHRTETVYRRMPVTVQLFRRSFCATKKGNKKEEQAKKKNNFKWTEYTNTK